MVDRVEVVTRVERRRRWTVEEKLRLVAATREPGSSVLEVARRAGVNPGLLFTRRRMADGRPARSSEPVTLLPVHVVEPAAPAPRGRPRQAARLEIGLPGGVRLKVDADIDPEALAAVVAVLQRR